MVPLHKLGFLIVLLEICTILAKRDDTLNEYATGRDVTKAVLRKISKLKIFPKDHNFLFRLAYVESEFGNDANTFRQGYYGGIWQVEESAFETTKTSLSTLSSHYAAINSTFEIDWLQVNWKQLLIPVYSGLAAALYLTCVAENKPIPQTVAGQVEFWKQHYNPLGDRGKFKNSSKELQEQSRCRGKMDLCIVLDGSGSIGQSDYQLAKDFVSSMITSFTLDYTRIGMIVFSSGATTIFDIDNSFTISQLAEQAKSASYPRGGTQTDIGIFNAIEMFTRSSNNSFCGIPKIMTVFTDGKSNSGSDMIGAAAGIQENYITSVSIGIGSSINPEELLLIALNNTNNVFTLQDFSSLQDFLVTITSVACEVPQLSSLNKTYQDSLIKKEKRFYRVGVPSKGLTVNLTENVGKTKGYWSQTDEAPSEAVNDGVLTPGLNFIPPLHQQRAKRSVEKVAEEKYDGGYVYITFEGVEEMNDYTLSMVEGNELGNIDASNGSGIKKLENIFLFILIFLHVALD